MLSNQHLVDGEGGRKIGQQCYNGTVWGLKGSRSASAIPPLVDICTKYNHKRAPQIALVNR